MNLRFYIVIEPSASYKWRICDRLDDRREKAYYTRKEAREACRSLNKGDLTWDDLWRAEDD